MEHELRVFRRSAEVGSVSIPDQVMDEREIDHLVDLPEQVVRWHDLVI
jgi:hypothetical protein